MLTQSDHRVAELHHLLLWPLRITPGLAGTNGAAIYRALEGCDERPSVWRRFDDGLTGDGASFQEPQYKEFVTFLPYVQRFLYGESRSARRPADDPPSEAAVIVYRRDDVRKLRIVLHEGQSPIVLDVDHVALYLFQDLDIAILNVELIGHDLRLHDALDLLYRFGRAYPAGWDATGAGLHSAHLAEWLGADGTVLARSDSAQRDRFLSFVNQHRAPAVVAHWDYLLKPLVLDDSDEEGVVRYGLVEVYRMPFMAYLALENPLLLQRDDFMQMALISQMRPDEVLPRMSEGEFEQRLCEDRFWTTRESGPNTRFLLNGHSLIAVGNAHSAYFTDGKYGQLAQFRRPIFLLFLIAHLHRAALLSFSDSMADATNDLDARSVKSVRRFRQRVRAGMESLLRFTHRFWFHQISEHSLVQSLFQRTARHLGNDALYRDVRDEISDMSQYLDSDAQRRQSATMTRLTVVTTFGLIGTVATGFLGMNLISEANAPVPARIGYFGLVLAGAALLTFFAVARSARLAELLETLADPKAVVRDKLRAFGLVFRSDGD